MTNGDNGNGSINRTWRIIETLLVAFIIGGITMWGTSQRFDERLNNIATSLTRIETLATATTEKLTQHLIEGARRDNLMVTESNDTKGRLKELRQDQVRRKANEKR